MRPCIIYLIEANLSICFFLLVYQILLKKETDHRFNRGYLLLALGISMGLPFFHFHLPSLVSFEKALPALWLPEIEITPLSSNAGIQVESFWFWAFLIYVMGVLVVFIVFLNTLLKIATAICRSPRFKEESFWVIELNGDREVFSFFKFIFISRSLHLTEIEKKHIIKHEQVHISNYHSFDILIINFIGVLFWFNPLLKTYRKSLVQLHEFEADARSVESEEVDSYCSLLAKAALQSSGYQLANHFTNSLTLKRIEMMKTVKTKISKWKVAVVALAAIAFCCLVGGSGFVLAQANGDKKNISTEEVFDQVDEMPSYGQGMDELFGFIAANLRYPEEAMKSKIEGKVFSEFVVELDGSLSQVKVIKGIGHGCDEEVVRVIKSIPTKWRPGEKSGKNVRTKMTLPILFQLSAPRKGG